jgi:hypothetical protein
MSCSDRVVYQSILLEEWLNITHGKFRYWRGYIVTVDKNMIFVSQLAILIICSLTNIPWRSPSEWRTISVYCTISRELEN